MSKDKALQQAVLAELGWEPSVTAAHIGVTASRGVVTLTGHVSNYPEKHAAEAAALRVKGVKAVADELEVKLPFDTKRDDEAIAAAAIERLGWDVTIPRNSVQVTVTKGWVTLSGQVDWSYQRDAAQHDVRGLHGVIGVSDEVTIRPRVNTANLSDDITHALHRSWFFDPQTVFVTAEGGNVHLSGTVHSPHDRQLAADTAWNAPGATYVENDIAVI